MYAGEVAVGKLTIDEAIIVAACRRLAVGEIPRKLAVAKTSGRKELLTKLVDEKLVTSKLVSEIASINELVPFAEIYVGRVLVNE